MKKFLFIFSCLLVYALGYPVLAETRAPDQTLDALARYQQSLLARADWKLAALTSHAEQISARLSAVSTSVLTSGDFGVLIWSQKSGLLELWREDEMISLSHYTDAQGRLAVISHDGFQVAIDLVANTVHLRLDSHGEVSFWSGYISSPGNTSPDGELVPRPAIIMASKKKCVCSGSENGCSNPDSDCINASTCSFTKANGEVVDSTCKYHVVTDTY